MNFQKVILETILPVRQLYILNFYFVINVDILIALFLRNLPSKRFFEDKITNRKDPIKIERKKNLAKHFQILFR